MRAIHKTAVSLLLFAFLAGSLDSNMRAPKTIPYSPSSILVPALPEATVLNERLEFNCDTLYRSDIKLHKAEKLHCQVMAEYNVRSKNKQTLRFQFIASSDQKIEIMVNDQKVEVKKIEEISLADQDYDRIKTVPKYRSSKIPALYSVIFEAKLQSAESNKIQVSYQQHLGGMEFGHGYFSVGKFKSQLSYEIWPLKEWEIDEDFMLHLKISIPASSLSFIDRLFSRYHRHLECHTITFSDSHFERLYSDLELPFKKSQKRMITTTTRNTLKLSYRQDEQKILTEYSFDSANLPDRIYCNMW